MHRSCQSSPKICILRIYSELSQKCVHAHAGHTQSANVVRAAVGKSTEVLRCNPANLSLTIDGKNENMNKRIGSVRV